MVTKTNTINFNIKSKKLNKKLNKNNKKLNKSNKKLNKSNKKLNKSNKKSNKSNKKLNKTNNKIVKVNINNTSKCKMIRHYTEPNEKYVCFSTSLFYKDEYIKVKKDKSIINLTKDKVNIFIKNIKRSIYNFNKVYPKNYYFRIYYDNSLFKLDEYKELFKEIKKNKKVQLIEYECSEYKNINNNTKLSHIDLFGTLLRFHAIFDDKCPNMENLVIVDADQSYTLKFIEILNNFIKSDKIILNVSKITSIPFHGSDFDKMNLFNFSYIIANCILIKKNKIFKMEIWNKYFNNLFNQYDLLQKMNYLDFKRLAINRVLNHDTIKTISYYSFNYGLDEIWINYILKKILKKNKLTSKFDTYFTKDYSLSFLLIRFIDLLKYNSIVNEKEFKLFIEDSNYKNLNEIISKINNLNEKYTVNDIKKIKFIKEIRKNKYFDRIYIQNNIKYIFLKINTLISKLNKYKMYDLFLY